MRRIDLEQGAERLAGIAPAEPVGPERDVAGWKPARDHVRKGLQPVGCRDDRAAVRPEDRRDIRHPRGLGWVEPVPALAFQRVAAKKRERGRRVDLGCDPELLGEKLLSREDQVQGRARADEPRALGLPADIGCVAEAIDPADQPLIDPVRLRWLRVVLVVERDVVEDVLALDVHPLDPLADDRRQLVGVGRVVGTDVGDGGGQDVRVAVRVLKPLAGERRPTRRRAHHEAAAARVGERPDLVAGSLEPEHRVVDVERDHRMAVRCVGGRRGLEARHRARLGDPLLEDLAVDRLAIRQEELGVDWHVVLAECCVDPDLLEQRVHAERPRFIRNDRDDPWPNLLVPDQVPKDPGEDHRRRDGHLRPGGELGVHRCRRLRQADAGDDPLRDLAAECPATLEEVLDLLRVRARVVIRRIDDLVVRDRQLQPIAEDPELRLVELLRLMGDIPSLDSAPERPALHRCGEDGRRGPL